LPCLLDPAHGFPWRAFWKSRRCRPRMYTVFEAAAWEFFGMADSPCRTAWPEAGRCARFAAMWPDRPRLESIGSSAAGSIAARPTRGRVEAGPVKVLRPAGARSGGPRREERAFRRNACDDLADGCRPRPGGAPARLRPVGTLTLPWRVEAG